MPSGVHNGPRGPKRTAQQRKLHRAEMVRLTRLGWTGKEIAEYLKVHPSTVCYDWKRVFGKLAEQCNFDLSMLKAEKKERLAHIIREALEAWELSKQPGVEEVEETTITPSGEKVTTRTVTKHRLPDPNYLSAVLRALHQEADIDGLGSKVQVNLNQHNDNREQHVTINWDAVSGDVPDEIEGRLQQVTGNGNGKPQGQLSNGLKETPPPSGSNGNGEHP